MSVTNPIYQASYAGRGDLGPYAITFDVTLDDGGNANDINVQVKDSLGTLTDITSTSTVTGMNVYTALVYDATYVVIVSRYPDLTQPYTFPYGTKFPSRTFENALDRQCFLLQRLYGDADLALKAPIAESPPTRIPAIPDRANTHLAFDSNGDPIASVGIPDVPVTAFMETLLDDTTAEVGRATLGMSKVKVKPYVVAAYNASTEWKYGADYLMTNGEDLGARLATIYNAGAGEIDVVLSAGTFVSSTVFAPTAAPGIRIRGQGNATVITHSGTSSHTVFDFSSVNLYAVCEDFLIEATTTSTAALITYVIGQTGTNSYAIFQRYKNITIRINTKTPIDQIGFSACPDMVECRVQVSVAWTTSDNGARAFVSCNNLYRCWASMGTYTSGNGTHYGFQTCYFLTDCHAIAGGSSTGTPICYGFNGCFHLVNCKGEAGSAGGGGQSAAFYDSDYLSSCYAKAGSATGSYGFLSCTFLSSCFVYQSTDRAYSGCTYLASCAAIGTGTTDVGFTSCEHLVACYATLWATGFSSCKQMQQCYSVANSTQYSTCYADQVTNAVANTAAGGYNR